ncbi:hypothetical protein KP509_12G097800 [Ceratopteris richardii]|uniref:Secreted protein n=1 Tax=Ceratopteris richardii TaxID=49495 RepID=A0A8T2TS67_CERRI|nr:hypothetical protein KP509_12G097800 [Ceratopteris richardii]
MHLAISAICLFFLSATPFCCGVYLQVNCLLILFSCRKSENSLEKYSPPPSDLKVLIDLPISFSTSTLNLLNIENTSDFCFIQNSHTFLE